MFFWIKFVVGARQFSSAFASVLLAQLLELHIQVWTSANCYRLPLRFCRFPWHDVVDDHRDLEGQVVSFQHLEGEQSAVSLLYPPAVVFVLDHDDVFDAVCGQFTVQQFTERRF